MCFPPSSLFIFTKKKKNIALNVFHKESFLADLATWLWCQKRNTTIRGGSVINGRNQLLKGGYI